MTDLVLLAEVIDRSGIKRKIIAEKLGITYSTFLHKMDGSSEFTVSQANIICEILGLDYKLKKRIFF